MFLILILIILEINLIFPKKVSNIYEIRIKIKGTGLQSILGDSDYFNLPDEIYLGESKIGAISNRINLIENENKIILRWNSTLQSCREMFLDCSNITEIDFSSFDNPNILSAIDMFRGCKSLISINFSRFYTSKVTSFYGMFHNCYNLLSLN